MAQQQVGQSGQKTYRSPQRKLVLFFEKSRNQWKAKCLEAKKALRGMTNRAHWLAQSRDRWKDRASTLARRVQELEAQVTDQQAALETLKKTVTPPMSPPRNS